MSLSLPVLLDPFRNSIHVGNSLYNMLKLPNNSVDTFFISPPYYGLRNYESEPMVWGGIYNHDHSFIYKTTIPTKLGKSGHTDYKNTRLNIDKPQPGYFCECDAWYGQLGLEPTPQLYIEHLMYFCNVVWDKLKVTGSLWMNLGDTYWGGGQAQGHDSATTNMGISTEGRSYVSQPVARGSKSGIKDKSLVGIPARFQVAAIDGGWICRNDIIWKKNNPLPSPHDDKLTVNKEWIFHLAKNNKPKYWYNIRHGQSTLIKPKGTKGTEDQDWYWKQHTKCYGKGCQICNNRGEKKATLWKARDYFYELKYEPFAEGSLERYYREKTKGMTKRKGTKHGHLPDESGSSNPDFHRQYGAHKFFENQGKHKRSVLEDIEYTNEELLGIINQLLSDPLNQQYPEVMEIWDVNVRGFKGAHFAVFPEELVQLIIDLACPKEVCTQCGIPRQKIYHKKTLDGIEEYKGEATKDYKAGMAQNPSDSKRSILESMSQMVTHVTRSKCSCNAPFKPGVIVDFFAGSGTVGNVAYKNGRDYILYELKEEYVKIIKKNLDIGNRTQRLTDWIK